MDCNFVVFVVIWFFLCFIWIVLFLVIILRWYIFFSFINCVKVVLFFGFIDIKKCDCDLLNSWFNLNGIFIFVLSFVLKVVFVRVILNLFFVKLWLEVIRFFWIVVRSNCWYFFFVVKFNFGVCLLIFFCCNFCNFELLYLVFVLLIKKIILLLFLKFCVVICVKFFIKLIILMIGVG